MADPKEDLDMVLHYNTVTSGDLSTVNAYLQSHPKTLNLVRYHWFYPSSLKQSLPSLGRVHLEGKLTERAILGCKIAGLSLLQAEAGGGEYQEELKEILTKRVHLEGQ